MMRNTDPFEPWNDPMYKDDPSESWNDPMEKDDPFAYWNDPVGDYQEWDHNSRE